MEMVLPQDLAEVSAARIHPQRDENARRSKAEELILTGVGIDPQTKDKT